MRYRSRFSSTRIAAAALVIAAVAAPHAASAQNFFDFLFNGGQPQKPQRQRQPESTPLTNFFADPFGLNSQPAAQPPRPVASAGSGPAFCVRTCDGKYFPLMARSGSTPAQMCQAFCPAAATKVFYGSSIEGASTGNGERYAGSDNAFAYRKALNPNCTCNGRSAAGLAPVDLTLDTSLRAGDVVATANGLVAYSGMRTGTAQTAEFTPVAAYPGLTSDVRSKLGEMKVAPVSAEMIDNGPGAIEARELAPAAPAPAKPGSPKARRADIR